jgi:hypothetical protein
LYEVRDTLWDVCDAKLEAGAYTRPLLSST